MPATDPLLAPLDTDDRFRTGIVSLIDEAEVPAEEAGKLVALNVNKGDFVQAGQLLALLDDKEAKERVNAAQHELDAATEQAENDIRVRAAAASEKVAESDEEIFKQVAKNEPGAVTEAEIRKLELATLHAKLQTELANHEQVVAKITQASKESQLEAAKILLEHRKIAAPIDGVVVETLRHEGEWLTAGQPLLRIVRMDRLEIESLVDAEKYLPEEVMGRPVEVKVKLTRDLVVTLNGEVTFASPLVEDQGAFRITVEFNNLKHNDNWVLRPGLNAFLTIDAAQADVSGLEEAAALASPKRPVVGAVERVKSEE